MKLLQTISTKFSQWRRKIATAAVALLTVYVAFHVIFGENGWVAYRHKKEEYKHLQQEVEQMQQQNKRLEQQIKGLKSDPETIEKVAREQLRYARPGEVIYVMPKPRPQASSQTPPPQK